MISKANKQNWVFLSCKQECRIVADLPEAARIQDQPQILRRSGPMFNPNQAFPIGAQVEIGPKDFTLGIQAEIEGKKFNLPQATNKC
jgi:hypothetical protein